ncbi:MAG: YitT family protein [Clostridia bacterium]|nr:YitT family protein [Clostridia bacterium]
MQSRGILKQTMSYVFIAFAACLMALNYYVFVLPNAFAPAGINGIATMIQYLSGVSISYMSLLINIPLAIAGIVLIGRAFTDKTLLSVLVFSGVLLLFQKHVIDIDRFIYHTQDGKSTILAPIAAGGVNGLIYGITVRNGGTTGGTDFIAAYVHKIHPEIAFTRVLLVFNAMVALASYFVYGYNFEPVILCIVYTYLTTHISGGIIRGGEAAIKIELITQDPDRLKQDIITQLRHSVTIIRAIGGYSGTEKTMMICVVNPHQIKEFLEIIRQYPGTFACVSDVTSTIGNFKHISGHVKKG